MPLISDSIGRVLGKRYRLVSALGAGASAHVFLAEDVTLQRPVAVKVLQPGLAKDESFLKRFRAEARSVASLNHPHILRVFDWGEDMDGPYLVLEYLGGGSMRDMLDDGNRLSHAQAARLGVEAAQGLAYAHARGLVHRDIKPANLLFDDEGRVRIADFGVARALAQASWTEPAGAIVGTARYASPEQAESRPVDGRADVYSLALVLFEAVTGVVPFVADTTVGTLLARVGQPLPSHRLLGPLDAVLARAAAPHEQARPDANELATRLGAVGAGLAAPDPLPLRHLRHGRGDGLEVVDFGNDAARRREKTVVGMLDPASGLGSPGPSSADGAAAGPSGTAPEEPAGSARTRPRAVRAGPGEVFDHEALMAGSAPRERATPEGAVTPGVPAGHDGADREAGAPDRAHGEPASPSALPASPDQPGPPAVVRRSRLYRWRWVVSAAVVATLVAVGLTVALQEQVFTPSRPVPALVGLSPDQARRSLAPGHFVLSVGAPAYSISTGAGLIASQAPAARSSLRQGSTVRVVPSKGPPPVGVPSLSGMDCSAATQSLESAHLKSNCPALSAYSPSIPAGQVINWSYANRLDPTSAPYGATILVAVSQGPPPIAIPNGLAGGTYTAAQSVLQGLGFTVTQAQESSAQYPSGQVTRTSPAAGVPAPVGSAVTVYVSTGPPVVAIPDVSKDSTSDATAALRGQGLEVGQVFGPPGGKVFTTDPPAGQQVQQGTSVNLYTK